MASEGRERIIELLEDIGKRLVEIMPGHKRMLHLANSSGVAFFFVLSIVAYLACVFMVMPANYAVSEDGEVESGCQTTAMWIFTFLCGSMMVNYFRAWHTPTFYDSGKLNVPTAEGGKNWGYCVPCQQYVPPRAHHCPVCAYCILRRESHCFFLGKCVGLQNLRFFVVYLFYTAVASLYVLLSVGTYLHHVIGPLLSWQSHYYLMPVAVIRFLSGSFPVNGCIALVLFYAMLMVSGGCCLLFFFHMNLILHGQTSYESANRNAEYDAGAHRNLQEVFGRYWLVCFLLPIKFALPVDGVNWNRMKNIKKY